MKDYSYDYDDQLQLNEDYQIDDISGQVIGSVDKNYLDDENVLESLFDN